MEETLNKRKPWLLPIGFMLAIIVGSFLENVFIFSITLKMPLFSGPMLTVVLWWPSVLAIETIIYWFIRRRIENRKWVWAHLLFSLFAFILLCLLYAIVLFFLFKQAPPEQYRYYFSMLQKFQQYAFWISLVIGNVFFVLTIVRSFKYKNFIDPNTDTDFLSELPG
jgi:Na+/phosphate symporter